MANISLKDIKDYWKGLYDWVSGQGNSTPKVQLTGSYSILAGEPKPAGKQDDTLLEYDTSTGETKVYKYISGDWREL